MSFQDRIEKLLAGGDVRRNVPRGDMIQACVEGGEAVVSKCGALATWTRPESTGRSPEDTLLVKRPESQANIDWTAANNRPIDPETFDMLVDDALATLGKGRVHVSDRVVGADSAYALPVTTISNRALQVLFRHHWHVHAAGLSAGKARPTYEGRRTSIPTEAHLDHGHRHRLRPPHRRSSARLLRQLRKLLFTVMNEHAAGRAYRYCSANGASRATSLLLSCRAPARRPVSRPVARPARRRRARTGRPRRRQFEAGAHAADRGPEERHGICLATGRFPPARVSSRVYPGGTFDLFDDRLTPNSRGSYLLSG
jgi:phosphoenolpyruvate carboxykinase (ATP)